MAGRGIADVTDAAYGAVGDGITDDTAAFVAAIAAVAVAGGVVFVPPGVYLVDCDALTLPGGVTLMGTGVNPAGGYAGSSVLAPTKGSIIRARGAGTRVVKVGDFYTDVLDSDSFQAIHTGAALANIIVDGANLATNAVEVIGARWRISDSQIWRGSSVGLLISGGQNGYAERCVVGQDDRGIGVHFSDQPDNKLFDCQVRGATTARVRISRGNTSILRCHIFPNSTDQTGPDVSIDADVNSVRIHDNEFGSPAQTGDHIVVNENCTNISIKNNQAYVTSSSAPAISFVKLDGTGISHFACEGNTVWRSGATGYTAIVRKVNGASVAYATVVGNIGEGVDAIWTGFTPGNFSANICKNAAGTAVRDRTHGKATLSGDGATTAFTIAHGMGAAPAWVSVTPGSAAAGAAHHVTADATNVTVTFAAAPASAADNLVLYWQTSL